MSTRVNPVIKVCMLTSALNSFAHSLLPSFIALQTILMRRKGLAISIASITAKSVIRATLSACFLPHHPFIFNTPLPFLVKCSMHRVARKNEKYFNSVGQWCFLWTLIISDNHNLAFRSKNAKLCLLQINLIYNLNYWMLTGASAMVIVTGQCNQPQGCWVLAVLPTT